MYGEFNLLRVVPLEVKRHYICSAVTETDGQCLCVRTGTEPSTGREENKKFARNDE